MRHPASGFTLAEVLVASALITVGLAGTSALLQMAAASSRDGRYRSAALFLADERAEQLRGTTWDAAGDCLGISPSIVAPPVTSTCPQAGADHVSFPDEGAGTLRAPFETLARTVRIEPCARVETCALASPDLRLITITISHGHTGLPILTLRGLVARRL